MKKTTSGKTSLGSGKGTISIGDWSPQARRDLTFGFLLDVDAALPDDYLDLIKPYIDLNAFKNARALTVMEAISHAPWEAIPLQDRRHLSRFRLVKIGEAHIELQRMASPFC